MRGSPETPRGIDLCPHGSPSGDCLVCKMTSPMSEDKLREARKRLEEPWKDVERRPGSETPRETKPESAPQETGVEEPGQEPVSEPMPEPPPKGKPEQEPEGIPVPTETQEGSCPHGAARSSCLECGMFRPIAETDLIAGEYGDDPNAPFRIRGQISTKSPEYRTFIENAEKEAEPPVLGKETVDAATRNGDLAEDRGPDDAVSAETLAALRPAIESLRSLIERKNASGGMKYYRIMILEATNDGRFIEAAKEAGIIEDGQDGGQQETAITEALMNGTMSDRLNLELLRAHIEEYRRAEKIWKEEIAKMKTEMAQRIEERIRAGDYPPEAREALKRLEEMNIEIADTVEMSARDMDQHGHSDPDENTIMVQHWQANLPEPDFMRQLFLHEATHSLEGRSVGVDTQGKVRHLRTGMTYRDRNRSYNWLNEAVAHRLSKEIAGNPEGVSEHDYDDHERLLEALTERVPLKTFLEAYFEDEDPSLPVAERRPKWQALKETLEKEFGPGFIEKLDELARKQGSKAALTRLRGGQGI